MWSSPLSEWMRSDAPARFSSTWASISCAPMATDSTDFTYAATYGHRLSRRGHMYLSATRQVGDAADVFSLEQISDPVLASIRDVQVVAQPMQRDTVRVGYAWRGRLLNFDVSAGRRKEKFDLVDQDPAVDEGADRKSHRAQAGSRLQGGPGHRSLCRRREPRASASTTAVARMTCSSLSTVGRQLTDKVRLELLGQRIERSDSPRDFDEIRAFTRAQVHAAAAAAQGRGGLRPSVRAAIGTRSRTA